MGQECSIDELNNGITLLNLNDYARAQIAFDELTIKHAGDWRAWLGLSIALNKGKSPELRYEDNIRRLASKEEAQELGKMIVLSPNALVHSESAMDVERQLKDARQNYQKYKHQNLTDKYVKLTEIVCIVFGVVFTVASGRGEGILLITAVIAFHFAYSFYKNHIRKGPSQYYNDEGYNREIGILEHTLENIKVRDQSDNIIKRDGRPIEYYISVLEKYTR